MHARHLHTQILWVLVSPLEWGVCWVGSGVCWLGAASLLPPSPLLDKIASGSIHTHTCVKSFIEIWQSIMMDPQTCQDKFWQTEIDTERHWGIYGTVNVLFPYIHHVILTHTYACGSISPFVPHIGLFSFSSCLQWNFRPISSGIMWLIVAQLFSLSHFCSHSLFFLKNI